MRGWLKSLIKKFSPLALWFSLELDVYIVDRLARVALFNKEIREVRELAEAEGLESFYKLFNLAVYIDRFLGQELHNRGGMEKFDEDLMAFRYSLGSRAEAFLWLCNYYKDLLDDSSWNLLDKVSALYVERAGGGFFTDLFDQGFDADKYSPVKRLKT